MLTVFVVVLVLLLSVLSLNVEDHYLVPDISVLTPQFTSGNGIESILEKIVYCPYC